MENKNIDIHKAIFKKEIFISLDKINDKFKQFSNNIDKITSQYTKIIEFIELQNQLFSKNS